MAKRMKAKKVTARTVQAARNKVKAKYGKTPKKVNMMNNVKRKKYGLKTYSATF